METKSQSSAAPSPLPSNALGGERLETGLAASDLDARWLGLLSYDDADALMRALAAKRRAGEISDTLLLLEHPPTITLGRGATPTEVVVSEAELASRGLVVRATDRGGMATLHAPGQLVGYPIVFVGREPGAGARLARQLGDVMLELATTLGVVARWRDDAPGVWTARGKLGAVGLRIDGGVSRHGFALNVSTDLSLFQSIIPCGLRAARATSVLEEAGAAPPMREAARIAAPAFGALALARARQR